MMRDIIGEENIGGIGKMIGIKGGVDYIQFSCGGYRM